MKTKVDELRTLIMKVEKSINELSQEGIDLTIEVRPEKENFNHLVTNLYFYRNSPYLKLILQAKKITEL